MTDKRKEKNEPIEEKTLDQISGGFDYHNPHTVPHGPIAPGPPPRRPIAYGPPPIKNHPA